MTSLALIEDFDGSKSKYYSFPTVADFVRFSEEENQDECLEINQKTRLSDAQLTDMLRQNPEYRNLGELSVDEYFGRIFQPNRIFVPIASEFRANASGFSFQSFRSGSNQGIRDICIS